MPRIKLPGRSAVYHCVSRVAGRERLLDDACQEVLAQLLWKMAGFCGVEVITYCFMANHFHILVRVPSQEAVAGVADAELATRLAGLYGNKGVLTVLARESIQQRGKLDDDVRARIVARMGDVSEFMKEFKQRFSRWYNRHHDREGTLWAERFRSVLVEDQPNTVEAVAAYIDLNPVRAGLVDDPKDYRFCGYAAALAGNKLARKGLMSIQAAQAQFKGPTPPPPGGSQFAASPSTPMADLPSRETSANPGQTVPSSPPHPLPPLNLLNPFPAAAARKSPAPSLPRWNSWPECAAQYRQRLFVRAGNVHQSGKISLSREKIREVLKQGGKLSLTEVLRLRVRHMTDGLALGTKEFVNAVFTHYRERFPRTRQDGARPLRFLAHASLTALRDLQVRVLG